MNTNVNKVPWTQIHTQGLIFETSQLNGETNENFVLRRYGIPFLKRGDGISSPPLSLLSHFMVSVNCGLEAHDPSEVLSEGQ